MFNKRNVVFIIIIIAAATLLSFSGGNSESEFQISENEITVVCPDNTEFTIFYEDISSIDLYDLDETGESIKGEEKSGKLYGTWENDDLGEYQACIYRNDPCCIVIRTDVSTYVFNMEEKDATENFYESLIQYIEVQIGQQEKEET